MRVVFFSPNSSSASCFLSVTTSSWSCSVHKFLPHFGSCWPPENRIRARRLKLHRLRRSRTRLCVLLHHRHALPPVHRNPLAGARVLDVRFLRQRSLDISVQELRVALLAVPKKFQSRVFFHMWWTTACCWPHRRRLYPRNTLLPDRPYALGTSRIDSDLHDLLHHVNCVHLLNLQATFDQFRTSNLLLRLAPFDSFPSRLLRRDIPSRSFVQPPPSECLSTSIRLRQFSVYACLVGCHDTNQIALTESHCNCSRT